MGRTETVRCDLCQNVQANLVGWHVVWLEVRTHGQSRPMARTVDVCPTCFAPTLDGAVVRWNIRALLRRLVDWVRGKAPPARKAEG